MCNLLSCGLELYYWRPVLFVYSLEFCLAFSLDLICLPAGGSLITSIPFMCAVWSFS